VAEEKSNPFVESLLRSSCKAVAGKKNLAQQLRHSSVVALLSESLAEEENADQLLNQVARTLMSVAKMRAAIEQAAEEEA
jgi:ferritin-like metal-binding protein YciE